MLFKILKVTGAIVLSAIVGFYIVTLAFPINMINTVDNDPSLPSITLNGHSFHSESFGNPNNPVLIAVHGGPGGDYRYMQSLKALSSKYFVVFYDQRMTGLSSRKSTAKIDVQIYMDDLHAFVTHYSNDKPVYIVVHSWGGMIASSYIGQHPKAVDKIVMIEPGILRADLAGAYLNQTGPGLTFMDFVSFGGIWLNQWRVDTANDEHARDDYVMNMIALHFGKKEFDNAETMMWRGGAYSQDMTEGLAMRDPKELAKLDFLKGVEKFEGEVLFLTSENNKAWGADYLKDFLKFYQHADQQIVRNSGHVIFVEQPKHSNVMIDTFLSK